MPRAAFTWVTEKFRDKLSVPVITSNRINAPDTAEKVLARGHADMISMARPLLADAEFVNKAFANQAKLINTCIGCNQACLDHIFSGQLTSCLVNPRACHETELVIEPTAIKKQIAVIGAGPAGLAAAVTAAARGHEVTLFDSADTIGGQFNLAKKIPGKEEFYETLRYFHNELNRLNVKLTLGTRVTADFLNQSNFDEVLIATGIKPRTPPIDGVDHPSVVSYTDVVSGDVAVGNTVAIIGAGGIGFDVAELLSHGSESSSQHIPTFMKEWGIDMTLAARGGIEGVESSVEASGRTIHLCQRKAQGLGKNLGKTTGWIHRLGLIKRGVKMLSGCEYHRIDDDGLHLLVLGEPRLLKVDNVVICAGQDPLREIVESLSKPYQLVGGADVASELDAKRAIDQGTRVAATI